MLKDTFKEKIHERRVTIKLFCAFHFFIGVEMAL